MADPERENDPCEGCEYEDDVCRENCSDCEHFEDPCNGCEFEDDICAENCDGCEHFEEDNPCDGCAYDGDECRKYCVDCEECSDEITECRCRYCYPCKGNADCECWECCPLECTEEDGCRCAACREKNISDSQSSESADFADEDTLSMLERVSDNLFDAIGREFRIEVYESSEVNASTNGSTVYVTSAAVQNLDENELACFISHEIAHIEKRHVEQTRRNVRNVAREAAGSFIDSSGLVSGLIQGLLVGAMGCAGVCRERRSHEFEADLEARKIMEKAGYDPDTAIDVLKKYRGVGGGTFDTHPSDSERIRNLKRNGR